MRYKIISMKDISDTGWVLGFKEKHFYGNTVLLFAS